MKYSGQYKQAIRTTYNTRYKQKVACFNVSDAVYNKCRVAGHNFGGDGQEMIHRYASELRK